MLRFAVRASFPTRTLSRSADLCLLVVAGTIVAAVPGHPAPVFLQPASRLAVDRSRAGHPETCLRAAGP